MIDDRRPRQIAADILAMPLQCDQMAALDRIQDEKLKAWVLEYLTDSKAKATALKQWKHNTALKLLRMRSDDKRTEAIRALPDKFRADIVRIMTQEKQRRHERRRENFARFQQGQFQHDRESYNPRA